MKILYIIIEDMGNFFLEESEDFFVLDIRDIMNLSVVEVFRKIEEIGKFSLRYL